MKNTKRKNCNNQFQGNFCNNCGQPSNVKRINADYVLHEIKHVLHLEHGILFTVKKLSLNPGININNYLSENRSRLVKPIIFIIIPSLIYSLIINFFHIEDNNVTFKEDGVITTPSKIFKWIQAHYGYVNIIIGVLIAFWLKLFFKKSNYNVFEILISLCFIMGIAMLIYSVFRMLQGLTKIKLTAIGGILGIFYSSWAIGQIFGGQKFTHYLKAFFAYLLGLITFLFLSISVGMLIDYLIIKL